MVPTARGAAASAYKSRLALRGEYRPTGFGVGSTPLVTEREQPMGLDQISAGEDAPERFNVVIEIPMNADPIKYEVDKRTGALFVDRFMSTAMHYPCNYGYIPGTLAEDGDPLDVLLVTSFALAPGVAARCRSLGVLNMQDERGNDSKILTVPDERVLPMYAHWQRHNDVQPERLHQIQHFFEHEGKTLGRPFGAKRCVDRSPFAHGKHWHDLHRIHRA